MSLPGSVSYHIISLGCSKNQVDSEKINGELASCGFTHASDAEAADLIIINTCGFIKDAKKESIDVIFDALAFKKKRASAAGKRAGGMQRRIVVCGCLSERYLEAVKADIPEIDLCYGIADAGFVPAICRAFDIDAETGVPHQKPLIESLPYRYIKISEGCSNNCSYCAIPSIRGGLKSYPPGAILEDVRRAAAGGAREMIIIAQDTSAYRFGEFTLSSLVERISGIEGVEWIRLLYCHPDHVDESIIDMLAGNAKVVKYIDIPFQHVSGRILASMGRKGSAEVYEDLIRRLRERVPSIRIRSTFMAGYPGETDEEYRELLSFINRTEIDRIGCFTYSREDDTAAATLPGQVPDRVKKARYDGIMRAQKKISGKKMDSLIGTTLRVIVEEQADEVTWLGRTEFDAPEVDGIFYLTGEGIVINTIVRARVTDSAEYDLFGVMA